jgi:hypothetical protein
MSKKIIPAVFFQKRTNGPRAARNRPPRLELFEKDLVEVTGGRRLDCELPRPGETMSKDLHGCDVNDDCAVKF